MTNIEKLEQEVARVSREELAEFSAGFRQFDAEEWERQIQQDIREGRLDKPAEETIAAQETGTTEEL